MKTLRKIISISALALLLSALVIFLPEKVFSSTDKGRADYWLKRYKEIKTGRIYKNSMGIFKKVLASSDRRKGVEPTLHIIDYDGLPWAQSLEDGSIILTRKAVEFCYRNQDKEMGDAKLAFVIGHELAHQYNGDFWPYRFMMSTGDNPEFGDIKRFALSPENIKSRELHADQYGIIYSSIAGFRTDVIVSKDKNFFSEWARATYPAISGSGINHPSVEQRKQAVVARLNDVLMRLDLFNMGIIAYHLGWYKVSIVLFDEFLKYYPGREVYHNIGTAYLRLAVNSYRMWKATDLPFHLSIEIDDITRANSITIGREEEDELSNEYREYMNKAIYYLKKAAESDPYYAKSRNNLGVAYIFEGSYYNALSELDSASNLMPEYKAISNNRAIAYFLLGRRINNQGLVDIAMAEFRKASSGVCSGIYGKNLLIAKEMLRDSKDRTSAVLEERRNAYFAPDTELYARVGSKFDKHDFKDIIDVGFRGSERFGVYKTTKTKEVILVQDGMIRLAYKRLKKINLLTKRRKNCYDSELFVSWKDNKGVYIEGDIFFVFQK